MPSLYWQTRYTEQDAIEHHASQNETISRDFLAVAQTKPRFDWFFRHAASIIEIGCGTGDLSAMLANAYPQARLLATDFSAEAIQVAAERHYQIGRFAIYDLLRDDPPGSFDLAVCSNTLEHFRDWRAALERLFLLAASVVVVVPFRQPVTDDYDGEGGAGHVASFTRRSFSRYQVHDSFVFQTHGWQHSSAGETPKQLAALLGRKT